MLDYKFQDNAVGLMHQANKGQFNYPTGTGKGNIQTRFISESIVRNPGFGIYIIVSPRIMLTNQLNERMTKELVKNHHIVAKRLTVHSGKEEKFDDPESQEEFKGLLDILNGLQGARSLNADDIKAHIEEAIQHNYPVTIASTYQSLAAVTAALSKLQIAANVTLYDESHYTTRNDFWDFVNNHSSWSSKNFYFTATRRVSGDDVTNGTGHDNIKFYGPVLDFMTIKDAIRQGYIVRPRMQIVEVIHNKTSGLDAVIATNGFEGHRQQVPANHTAKLLVNCDSTKQISDIIHSDLFKNWISLKKSVNPNFKWFAISSTDGAIIDGLVVDRKTFLDHLNAHRDDAIVFHIRILTEGIDVPDMTGVMFMSAVETIRFFQTVGRATRLHKSDRAAFEAGIYGPEDLDKMLKPYSWIIIPKVNTGSDVSEFIQKIYAYVRDMREYSDSIFEEISWFEPGSSVEEEQPDGMNQNQKKSTMIEVVKQLGYLVEDEELAKKLGSDDEEDQIFAFEKMFARV